MSDEKQIVVSKSNNKKHKVIADIEDVMIELGNETLKVREDDPRYQDKVNAIHFKLVALSNIRTVLMKNVAENRDS